MAHDATHREMPRQLAHSHAASFQRSGKERLLHRSPLFPKQRLRLILLKRRLVLPSIFDLRLVNR